jgi:NAD-dependent protein deacetylase/lipoamidase
MLVAVESVDALARLISESRVVLVFTGAGISTGSGIPDYRGPEGVWKTKQPVFFDDFMSSEAARTKHWQMKLESHEMLKNAQPNAAHRAIAELERLGRLEVLVTQNIDGLHLDAGNTPERTIEIHGTSRMIECMSCHELSEPQPAMSEFRRTGVAPLCGCGGYLKSATISFGQPMPEAKLARAFEAAERTDLVMAIGTTLEVQPAASIPLVALRRGARYAIINRGPTAQDEIATIRIEGDAVEVLPRVVARLKASESGAA